MASSVGTVASSIFNAFAFAGAGFIFSTLNHSGYTQEMHRHNQAMEKLTKQRDLWNQQRDREIDRVTTLHYEQQVGDDDIKHTNDDLDFYRTLTQQQRIQHVHQTFEQTKPQLKYTPSTQFQQYIDTVKFISASVVSSLALMLL